MTTDTRTALIRPARPADAPAITQVHVETWRDTYAGILPASYLVHRMGASLRQAGRRPARAQTADAEATMVAEVDGQVVGYVSFGPARHVRDNSIGEIYALYVAPEFQGCGIGRSLVCVVLDRMFTQGRMAVDVEVLEANPARFFYVAAGATMIGTGTHRFAGETLAVIYYRWQRKA